MPEVGTEQYFSPPVKDRIKDGQPNISQALAASIVDTTDLNRLQGGNESAIIRVGQKGPDEKYKIVTVSINEMSPGYAKYLFYTHNIFATLFPHNFPRFHAAIASNPSEGHFGGTIREGVQNPKNQNVIIKALKAVVKGGKNKKYPFNKVTETCRKYQIPLATDNYKANFILGKDGGEYYVDTIKPISPDDRFGVVAWNLRTVQQFINDKPYKHASQREKDMRSVTNKLERLRELGLITLTT